MAVQANAPGGPAGQIAAGAPEAVQGRAGNAWSEFRRFPVIPLIILVLVLIIPAVFANVLAPHGATDNHLDSTKLPPVWVGDQVLTQEIVQRVQNDETQVNINNVRHLLASGAGTLDDRNGNGEAELGEALVQAIPGGSWEFPLGTDKLGRDVLSRLLHGARVSLMVSCLAILLGGFLGTTLGMLAAFRGGIADGIIMRVVDIKLAFPSILLALTLVAAVGSGYVTVITVIALLLWARYARVVRGDALAIKQRDFVDRARVAGASNARIMMRHIFPNVFNTVIVLATLEVGHVIILEATLSYLGAGIRPPAPSWGVMAADGRELITSAWWMFLFPCLAIVMTVLSMNLLGDWLRDRLDPRLRNV